MTFVDPGDFVALQVVNETNMDNIRNDLIYLNDRINPTGVMLPYAGTAAPTGWLLCDGTAVSRTTYAALYAITGDAYGPGNGSTTFNLPDLRQRFPMGKAASGTGSTMGAAGGSKDAIVIDHNHAGNSHNHTQNAHSHGNDAHDHPVDDNETGGHTHASTGAGQSVMVIQTGAGPYNVNGSGSNWVTFDVGHTARTDTAGAHNHDIDVTPSTITIHNQTATNQSTTATVQNTGSSGTDQNLPPYQVMTFIIKF